MNERIRVTMAKFSSYGWFKVWMHKTGEPIDTMRADCWDNLVEIGEIKDKRLGGSRMLAKEAAIVRLAAAGVAPGDTAYEAKAKLAAHVEPSGFRQATNQALDVGAHWSQGKKP